MEHTFPAGPFTRGDALSLGIPGAALRAAVDEGLVIRPMHGVYLSSQAELTVPVRAAAAKLVTGASSVLVDRTASWLWDVDVFRHAELDGLPPLESCVLPGNQATHRDQVDGVIRDLLPVDWVEVGGVRVTTPLRTAADLGCKLWAPHALGAMDALMRAHGFSQRDLQLLLRRYRGRRGVVQLRRLVALVDPRAESQPESWVRWFITDYDLPRPEPQVWVVVEGCRVRLDLAYPRARVLVEYDGEEFHTFPEDRGHDERRREALRREGWYVIVVDRRMLTAAARDLWLSELHGVLRDRGVLA